MSHEEDKAIDDELRRDGVRESALQGARDIGEDHGRNAATWFFDGNTTEARYRQVLKWIDDGDPELWDHIPTADLSGQWADGYTVRQLCDDLEMPYGDEELDSLIPLSQELGDAYEEAFNEASADEVERVCRYHLAE